MILGQFFHKCIMLVQFTSCSRLYGYNGNWVSASRVCVCVGGSQKTGCWLWSRPKAFWRCREACRWVHGLPTHLGGPVQPLISWVKHLFPPAQLCEYRRSNKWLRGRDWASQARASQCPSLRSSALRGIITAVLKNEVEVFSFPFPAKHGLLLFSR